MGKFGYWGRYKQFYEEDPRLIWIGPMSEQEMLDHFNEFRHQFKSETHPEDSADRFDPTCRKCEDPLTTEELICDKCRENG